MAFPTTGILDNFNRANENPIDPPWTNGIYVFDNPLAIDTNALVRPGAAYGSAFLTGPYGPDVEAWAVVDTPSTDGMELAVKIANTGGTVTDFYMVHIAGHTGTWQFWKSSGGVQSTISSPFAGVGSMSAGDSFGFEVIGDDLTAYFKPAAGAWSAPLFTGNDSEFSGLSGGLGLLFQNATWRIDTVGGGDPVTSIPGQLGSFRTDRIRSRRTSW